VKFRFMDAEKAHYPMTLMCRVLKVSRSGYYAWARRPAARQLRDEALAVRIREVHRKSKGRYGSPRVHRALRAEGHRVSRKRVARVMKQAGLRGKKTRRFIQTTISLPNAPAAPNILNRDFKAAAPNLVWTTDITAIWTLQGWLYLAVVMDLFSRRIVGHSMQPTPGTGLCVTALTQAIGRRRPAPGLIHHSDRGVQYTSHRYQVLLAKHGMRPSMSRRANCWDNAVTESFFGTLKVELDIIGHGHFRTRDDARRAVFEYIEGFYNRERMHSTLGYVSPARYEETPRAIAHAA
jgi:transposase InsO family protein